MFGEWWVYLVSVTNGADTRVTDHVTNYHTPANTPLSYTNHAHIETGALLCFANNFPVNKDLNLFVVLPMLPIIAVFSAWNRGKLHNRQWVQVQTSIATCYIIAIARPASGRGPVDWAPCRWCGGARIVTAAGVKQGSPPPRPATIHYEAHSAGNLMWSDRPRSFLNDGINQGASQSCQYCAQDTN